MKKLLYATIYRADIREETNYRGVNLALPATPEAIRDAMDQARIEKPEDIVVSECYGMNDAVWLSPAIFPDELSFPELNFFAARMAELDDESLGCLNALVIKENPGPSTLKQLINLTYNSDLYCWQPALSDEQLGEFYVENVLAETLKTLPENAWQELRQYMTLDKVGRIQREREGGMFVCNGYVSPNPQAEFQAVYDGEHLPMLPAWLTSPPPVCRVQLKRVGADEEMTAPGGPDDPSTAWLSFPHTEQEVRKALERLGAESLEECLICHAESAWVPDLEELIRSDSDLELLQMLAERLTEVREQGRLRKYKAALDYTDCPGLGYAADLCRNLDCFAFYPEYVQPSDYARMVLTRKYGLTDQTFYSKVDLDAFGYALMEDRRVSTTPYGYMSDTDRVFQYEYAQNPYQAMSGLQP